jgi:hypothetical protein
MKVKVKLEFKNGMVFESQEWNQVKSQYQLECIVQKMIQENGVELGKPKVTYITDPEEKRDPSNLAWTPVKINDISEGNYVTQILAKTPRKIAKIDKTTLLVTLYEEGRDHPYFKANPEYPMDLLIDTITREPVMNLEAYYE